MNWNAQFIFGKSKSDPQKFQSFGNGGKVYLNKPYLLNGSVKVYLNNQKLIENQDYSLNYFDGVITFNQNIMISDFIKVIYETSNPVLDFIPSLARKSITGGEYQWRLMTLKSKEKIVIKKSKQLLNADEITLLKSELFNLESEPFGSVKMS